MTTDRTEMDWRHQARCRNYPPSLFQPIGNTGPALLQIEEAKAVCRRCPVQPECLQFALDGNEPAGVWGGLSEDERRAMKRRASRERSQQKTGTRLYPQDLKIFARYAEGHPYAQIANELGVQQKTVGRTMTRIRRALGVPDEELIQAGREAGLLPAGTQYAEAA